MAPAGRRGGGGELSSTQATLLLQEELLRRGERERRALREKVTALERSLHAAEGERRAAQVGIAVEGWILPLSLSPTAPCQPSGDLQERMSAVRAGEAELEDAKRRLEAAENRSTRLELQQRVLEGELQRARLALGERQAEVRALQDRAELLQKQVTAQIPVNPHCLDFGWVF